jgi:hypothetical protein
MCSNVPIEHAQRFSTPVFSTLLVLSRVFFKTLRGLIHCFALLALDQRLSTLRGQPVFVNTSRSISVCQHFASSTCVSRDQPVFFKSSRAQHACFNRVCVCVCMLQRPQDGANVKFATQILKRRTQKEAKRKVHSPVLN